MDFFATGGESEGEGDGSYLEWELMVDATMFEATALGGTLRTS
jgi:hypothetical protein